MKNPIEILNDRLFDISDNIVMAYKNNLPKEDINKMIDLYNEYYVSIQLIFNHTEKCNLRFPRLHLINNSIYYKTMSLKKQLNSLRVIDNKEIKMKHKL